MGMRVSKWQEVRMLWAWYTRGFLWPKIFNFTISVGCFATRFYPHLLPKVTHLLYKNVDTIGDGLRVDSIFDNIFSYFVAIGDALTERIPNGEEI